MIFRNRWTNGTKLAFGLMAAAASLVPGCGGSSTCTDRGEYCPGQEPGGASNAGSAGTPGKGGTPATAGAGAGEAGSGGKAAAGSASGTSGSGGKPNGGDANAGGEGGNGGAAGGVVTLPCDGACQAPKPVCDEPNDTCVQCLQEPDCTAGAKKKCDLTAKTCVECLAPVDCPSATAAKCGAGSCVKCTSNDDCKHVAGKGVCDTGTCVQCTPADESACSGRSCNPATKSCTGTAVGTRDYCQSCIADSECFGGNKPDPDARCVPMEFNGTPRTGGFCLKRVVKTCARPFKIPLAAASLSGAASETYCGIDQDNVTCEAVLDLSVATCAADDGCGCTRDAGSKCIGSGQGGLCRTVGVDPNRCTYTCGVPDHCPSGTTCTGAQPYCH